MCTFNVATICFPGPSLHMVYYRTPLCRHWNWYGWSGHGFIIYSADLPNLVLFMLILWVFLFPKKQVVDQM